ncbi:hypothetical protein SELMODRAFT_412812 [Selaginella moellendorffii]|uniref:Uncharacterized protein n=1 Tax=Selaginella moellendorffii TaxID=88036 RepID=D8RMD8_SELML|nr:hypothetical protein SELMODRAFT_412812 [Selaginella moellendorffii]
MEFDADMPDRGTTVRSFLESQVVGKPAVIDRAVQSLESEGYEFVGELKNLTYDEVIQLRVPVFAAKKLEPHLKVPAARREPITKGVVEAILQKFGDQLSGTISSMTPEHAFKRKFPLTKVPICQIPVSGGWQPSLLWHDLEQPLGSGRILSLIKRSKPSLLILFGISGSGKTRCLYEIAVQQTCLYFSGVCSGSPTADGSRDLLVVSETLQRLYPTGPIPVSSLKTCLRAVILSRLFIHCKFDDLLKPLSNLTFLFKQVMHRQLNYIQADPWAYLTGCILTLAESAHDLPALESVLSEMLYAYTWDWPIILDECQEVNTYLKDRFMTGDGETGSLRRSMLDTFVIALQDAGFKNTVIFAGTGRSLFHVATHVSETLKHRASIYWYTSFGEFRDGKVVVLNPTLSLVEFGLGRLSYEGHGLMQWVYQGHDGIIGHADASEGCQAVEIFEPLVCRALWHYFQENSSLQHIQQHHFLEKAELSASATGEVYETAVAEMIGKHLDGKCLADLFSSWNTQPIPAIYNNTATLVRPKVDHLNLVGTETEDFRLIDWINSVTSGQDNFFTFFSTGRNKTCGPDIWWFLTVTQYAQPEQGDKLQCAGEPSSGEQADDRQSVTTFIICAAQMKTLQKMARGDYQKAISSLDSNKLFLHKKGGKKAVTREEDDEGAKRVRELARFGCLKLVVTTDFVDLTKFQPKAKQHPAKLRKLNTAHCQQDCVPGDVPALLGVIDSTNICMFVERWLIESVKICKDSH